MKEFLNGTHTIKRPAFSYFFCQQMILALAHIFSGQTKNDNSDMQIGGGEDGCIICTYVLEEDEYILMN